MSRQIKNKRSKSLTIPGKVVRKNIEDDLFLNSEDLSLLQMINDYMKGRLDLDDVRNDPALPQIEKTVRDFVLDYHNEKMKNKENEKFIRDNLSVEIQTIETLQEISIIKDEIDNSNINEVSAEWVKDWHIRKEINSGSDHKIKEIRDFITSSLESDKDEPEISSTGNKKKVLHVSFIRIMSLSAAAIISTFILIKTLLPSYNPDKLFSSYYEPLSVVLPVTRGLGSSESNIYTSGIEKYKLGDYQGAAKDFSNAMLKDNTTTTPLFFSGISNLALGNYDQAVNLLSKVGSRSGEFGKEAEWYLGLAYLKTGEKEKALICFEFLAQSPGYYRERAEKIIRHLK
jgi:tetratricopeptide (TPR) repeat protein